LISDSSVSVERYWKSSYLVAWETWAQWDGPLLCVSSACSSLSTLLSGKA